VGGGTRLRQRVGEGVKILFGKLVWTTRTSSKEPRGETLKKLNLLFGRGLGSRLLAETAKEEVRGTVPGKGDNGEESPAVQKREPQVNVEPSFWNDEGHSAKSSFGKKYHTENLRTRRM